MRGVIMYTKSSIMDILKKVQRNPLINGYHLGLAGSYVRGEESSESDIDIIVDKDMLSIEQIEFIKSNFSIKVDVVQLPLLKQEDEMLDATLVSIGLPKNKFSAYKEIMKEVEWVV